MKKTPFILTILDGWGFSEDANNNAIMLAKTPNWDKLWSKYPHTLLDCSGSCVGLPNNQIGNSEVGHMHMGAGRVVTQPLTRINDVIDNNKLDQISRLTEIFSANQTIHLIGLLSNGGVHAHEDHFIAMINFAKQFNCEIYIHAFLDGRDTPPKSAEVSLKKLSNELSANMKIASICGRYFAMDRDNRWDRTDKAYTLLTSSAKYSAISPLAALNLAYARGETDEFVQPTYCTPEPILINDNDKVIFMNYRGDRARQLTSAFR